MSTCVMNLVHIESEISTFSALMGYLMVSVTSESAISKTSGSLMSCYVYILGSEGCGPQQTYVGWTTDLDRRLAEHNAGVGARSTRGRKWSLLYAERHLSRGEAMSREWHLKRDRAFRRRISTSET